jgi:hypothetical protein
VKVYEIINESFNPQVQDMQKELKAAGEDLGPFGPNNDGIDGWLGPYTMRAAMNQPEIAEKYKSLISSYKPDADADDNQSSEEDPTFEKASAYGDRDGSVVIGDQRRIGGSISWRTNNPGNVMISPIAKKYGAVGQVKASDKEPIAIMPSLGHGLKLQAALWRRPMYNNLTIDAGAQQWATGVKQQGYGSKYARDLASGANATLDTKISDLSDNQLIGLCKAQMKWEGWHTGKVTQA